MWKIIYLHKRRKEIIIKYLETDAKYQPRQSDEAFQEKQKTFMCQKMSAKTLIFEFYVSDTWKKIWKLLAWI